MTKLQYWHPYALQTLNWLVMSGSVLLCLLILPTRIPGMELLGIGPNWLMIWVVAWSVRKGHNAFQGALAGMILGLIQDSMTVSSPTHMLSLAIVGVVTTRIQKQRYIREDFITIAIIAFLMAILSETVVAIQFSLHSFGAGSGTPHRTLSEIWSYHQRIALSSAILSSLWAPVIYYPLKRWWQHLDQIEQSQL